ncbi:MAG: hypothetical protein ACRCTQ_00005, partial [Brevinemataceae bacterium]
MLPSIHSQLMIIDFYQPVNKKHMNLIKHFTFTCIITFISCNPNFEELNIQNNQNNEEYNHQNITTVPEDLIKRVAKSLTCDPYCRIEPIMLDNNIYFWQINYSKGHYILSSIKGLFPIIQYSNKSFEYKDLDSDAQKNFINNLRHITESVNTSTKSTQEYSLWDDIIYTFDSSENDSISYDYEIDFSFELPTEVNEISTLNHLTKSPVGLGHIPNRTYRIGYPTTSPLLYLNNRQWSTDVPYNFNMPAPYLYPREKERILPIILCFAMIMDYHRIPDYSFWARQPNRLYQNVESELSSFLLRLSIDLGYRVSNITSYMPEENIDNFTP